MAESILLTEDRTTDTEHQDGQAVQAEAAAGVQAPVLTEELLVEEVSIDGMCGVY